MSGFSRKRSSCELGLSSTVSLYSRLQRWVCPAWALFSAFYGESSYFGICVDDLGRLTVETSCGGRGRCAAGAER